jgi:hypothetical protein
LHFSLQAASPETFGYTLAHFPMKNTPTCILSAGFVTAMRLQPLGNIGYDFHDDESQIDVCSVMFTDSCEELAHFRARRPLLNVQCDRMLMEKNIEMAQYSSRVST